MRRRDGTLFADLGDNASLELFVVAIGASATTDEDRLALRCLEPSHAAGRRGGAFAQETIGRGNGRITGGAEATLRMKPILTLGRNLAGALS
jgi:hypothetical protein